MTSFFDQVYSMLPNSKILIIDFPLMKRLA